MRKHIFVALLILFCSFASAQTQMQELYVDGSSLSANIANSNGAINFGATTTTQGANGAFSYLGTQGISNNGTMTFGGLASTSTDAWVGQSTDGQNVVLQAIGSVLGTGSANAGGSIVATAFKVNPSGLFNASGIFVANQVVVINFGPGLATGATITEGQSN